MKRFSFAFALFGCALAAACSGAPAENDAAQDSAGERATLTIYSARHYDGDRALFEAFGEANDVRIRLREARAPQLLETMKAEGSASPADIVIAADAGSLHRFDEAGLLASLDEDLLARVPEQFRDTDGHWIGLARRARVIAYDPEQVAEADVARYTDLADPALEGKVCQRASSNVYNLSLVSDLIDRLGSEETRTFVEGMVGNFARNPQGGDTTQLKAIADGACGAAFVNHYYYVRMAASGSKQDREAASRIALSFPSEAGRGTHVNITGAAIGAHSDNRDAAEAIIRFLLSPDGQTGLIAETGEYPMTEGAELPPGLSDLPEFEASPTPAARYGERQSEAQRLLDEAGWN